MIKRFIKTFKLGWTRVRTSRAPFINDFNGKAKLYCVALSQDNKAAQVVVQDVDYVSAVKVGVSYILNSKYPDMYFKPDDVFPDKLSINEVIAFAGKNGMYISVICLNDFMKDEFTVIEQISDIGEIWDFQNYHLEIVKSNEETLRQQSTESIILEGSLLNLRARALNALRREG